MATNTFTDAFKSSVPRVNLRELSENKPYGRVTSLSYLQDVLCESVEHILREQAVEFDPELLREQARAQLARALS